MQKVILTKGLPGAGKDYWAKQFVLDNPSYIRINRDDMRNMRGKYWLPKQEDLITAWEESMVVMTLNKGYNVIIADTNLNPKVIERWKSVVARPNLVIEIKDFTHVPLKVCIERDLQRINSVGEKVIRRMYYQYLMDANEIKQDPKLAHAMICDLDGTLCLFGKENPYDRDFSKDILNETILQIIAGNPHNQLIFLSGRNGKYEKETREWLNKNVVEKYPHLYGYKLYMRKEGDNREDSIVKLEMFNQNIRDKYYVEFVLDDRNQIVDVWRSLGLICLQVADGAF